MAIKEGIMTKKEIMCLHIHGLINKSECDAAIKKIDEDTEVDNARD